MLSPPWSLSPEHTWVIIIVGVGAYTFTVVTGTYNRAHLLPRVYSSLCEQTFGDFEWIVVDDGSTDGTRKLVAAWMDEGLIDIRYYYQRRQGWHVAFNYAARESRGCFINNLDSDDWYPPFALESWHSLWMEIPDVKRGEYFAVAGLCSFSDGMVVGDPFPADRMDTDQLEIRLHWRVRGDKALSCRTDIVRRFAYPEDLGRFVTISMTWNRIAQHFKSRCTNHVLKFVEYQPDGLTAHTVRNRALSPAAARVYYQELLRSGRPIRIGDRFRLGANYVRYSLHGRSDLWGGMMKLPATVVWFASIPAGMAAYLHDAWILFRGKDRGRLTRFPFDHNVGKRNQRIAGGGAGLPAHDELLVGRQ